MSFQNSVFGTAQAYKVLKLRVGLPGKVQNDLNFTVCAKTFFTGLIQVKQKCYKFIGGVDETFVRELML